jgi:hypothetical protein
MYSHQNLLVAIDPSIPSILLSLLSISISLIFKTVSLQENRSGPTSVRLNNIYQKNTLAGPSNKFPRESLNNPIPQTHKARPNWDEKQKERREEEITRGYTQKRKKKIA